MLRLYLRNTSHKEVNMFSLNKCGSLFLNKTSKNRQLFKFFSPKRQGPWPHTTTDPLVRAAAKSIWENLQRDIARWAPWSSPPPRLRRGGCDLISAGWSLLEGQEEIWPSHLTRLLEPLEAKKLKSVQWQCTTVIRPRACQSHPGRILSLGACRSWWRCWCYKHC
jgi:hypothetical protein